MIEQHKNYKSEKDKQYNGWMKNDKRRNNDLQQTTQKTKDRATRTPPNSWGELMCSGRIISYCSTSGTRQIYFLGLLGSNTALNIISAMHVFFGRGNEIPIQNQQHVGSYWNTSSHKAVSNTNRQNSLFV